MKIDPEQMERMAGRLPIGRDPASVRRRLEAMEGLLERALVVPGTNYRIGADSIVGLIPVVGDLIAAAMGAWLIWEAKNLGMSRFQRWRMAGNIAVDTAIGAVPLIGDAFDLVFRSNTRNLRIIKRWLDRNHPEPVTIEGEVVSPQPSVAANQP
ncbi:DUF4112 domain-containing protein [Allosphingosinicella sp.]|uniref:DUF4112 domain-containing protein n=1 Tax=Allosphingosinicella sp. TaxID=2823234 RepID=UPI003D718365